MRQFRVEHSVVTHQSMINGLQRWVSGAQRPKIGPELRPSYFQRLKASLLVAMQEDQPVLPREFLSDDLQDHIPSPTSPETQAGDAFTFD